MNLLQDKIGRYFLRLMVVVWLLGAAGWFAVMGSWSMALCVLLISIFPAYETYNLLRGKCNLCGRRLDGDK